MARKATTNADFGVGPAFATAPPFTIALFHNPTLGIANSGSFIFSLGHNQGSNYYQVGWASDSSHTAIVEANQTGTVTATAKSTVAGVTNTWMSLIAVVTPSLLTIYLNGAAVGTKGLGGVSVTAITQAIYNGRPDAPTHPFPAVGDTARVACYNRALTPLEVFFLSQGGNCNLVPGGLVSLYNYLTTENATITDLVGNNDIVLTGTTAGSSDPVLATAYTGAAIPSQSWAIGHAIVPVNVAPLFEILEGNDYVPSLMRLGAPVAATTTTQAAATATQDIPIASGAAFVGAGDWLQVAGGVPSRLLAVDSVNGLGLVTTPQTFALGATVYRCAAAAYAPGPAFTGKVLQGSPTGVPGTAAQVFVRATTGALTADSPLFNVTLTSVAPSLLARPRSRRRHRVATYKTIRV